MDSFKYSFRSALRENLSLAVYNTGYQKCDRSYSWGPAARDHYLIHYIASGKGIFYYEGKTYALSQGDMFLIAPSQLAAYTADNTEPWEYYWVGFNGTEAHRLLNMSGFTAASPVLHLYEGGTAEPIQQLLLCIYQSRGNTPSADANMIGYLYLFLGKLIELTGNTHKTSSIQDYLAQALRFMQYNFAGDIGVEDVASYVGISRSQLYRAFMATFSMSPHEFLQQYRINEACSLLRRGAFSVAEVASSVGYNDALYFSRVFKKRKGMTPTEYEALAQTQEESE